MRLKARLQLALLKDQNFEESSSDYEDEINIDFLILATLTKIPILDICLLPLVSK